MAHIGTTRESRSRRLSQVRAWKASGLSAREFGLRHGIAATTLSWWRWRLAKDGEDLSADPRRRRLAVRKPGFVEITPSPDLSLPTQRAAGVRVELGGVSILLESDFDEQALSRVLAVLERRP
jgi:transposase